MTTPTVQAPLFSPLVGEDKLVHHPSWLEFFNRINAISILPVLSSGLLAANNLSDVANVVTSRNNLGLGAGSSVSFASLNLSSLTASEPVVTDGSKNLVSVSYTTFANSLGLGPASSPTFAGLTLDNFTGLLRANFGVVGTATIGSSLIYAGFNLNTIQDIRTTASPTFADETLTNLTPSYLVATDKNKKLVSVPKPVIPVLSFEDKESEEFLMIPGTKGDKGDTGQPGQVLFLESDSPDDPLIIPGPQGPQGIQGIAGPMREPDDPEDPLMIPGPTGLPGAIGPVGPTGATGITVILEPEEPEVPIIISGPQGLQGIPGPIGPAFVFEQDVPEDLPMMPPGISQTSGASTGTTSFPAHFLSELDPPEDFSVIPGPKGDKGDKGDTGDRGSVMFLDSDPDEPMIIPGPQGNIGAAGGQGAQGTTGPAFFVEPQDPPEDVPEKPTSPVGYLNFAGFFRIVVSAVAPQNPSLNDLWLDIS